MVCLVITRIPVPKSIFSKDKQGFKKTVSSCQYLRFQSKTFSLGFSCSESPHLKHQAIVLSFVHFLQPLATCPCHYLIVNVSGAWIVLFRLDEDTHKPPEPRLIPLSSFCPLCTHGPCPPRPRSRVCVSMQVHHSRARERGSRSCPPAVLRILAATVVSAPSQL